MREDELRAGLVELGAATLYEVAGRRGALDGAIRPLAGDTPIAGPAATAICHPGDNLAVHRAVARLEAGAILVVDGRGVQVGYLGDILATGAHVRGALGAVVDGGVRDLEAIRSLGFGLWARGPAIARAPKTTPGEVGGPISCGGA
jgi:4-hydroxy-4-methyl-2-oxoglutarate aldolase